MTRFNGYLSGLFESSDSNQLGDYFYDLYRMRHKEEHKISKPPREKYKSK